MICVWLGSTGSCEALRRQESPFPHGPPGLDQDICHSSIISKWLHGNYSSQEATAYPQGDGRLQDEKQCFCQACPLLHFSITYTNALLRSPVVKIRFSNISNYFKIIVPFWEGILSCLYFPVRWNLVHILNHSQECRTHQKVSMTIPCNLMPFDSHSNVILNKSLIKDSRAWKKKKGKIHIPILNILQILLHCTSTKKIRV